MKNIIKYAGWLIAAALGITLIVLMTTHDHDHDAHAGHDHGAEEGHDDKEAPAGGIKEVLLNDAQFKAAGVSLGAFEKKNMSEVVKLSGFTKLPPQNKALVSAPLSGIIKQIKVIEGQ